MVDNNDIEEYRTKNKNGYVVSPVFYYDDRDEPVYYDAIHFNTKTEAIKWGLADYKHRKLEHKKGYDDGLPITYMLKLNSLSEPDEDGYQEETEIATFHATEKGIRYHTPYQSSPDYWEKKFARDDAKMKKENEKTEEMLQPFKEKYEQFFLRYPTEWSSFLKKFYGAKTLLDKQRIIDDETQFIERMNNESKKPGKKIYITEEQFKYIVKEEIEKKNGLPIDIIKSIELNKTSLGNHPSFPPEDEKKFEYKLLSNEYNNILSDLKNKFPSINIDNIDTVKSKLSSLLTECHDIEKPLKSQLEKIVMDSIKEIFDVDGDDVDLNVELVDVVTSNDIKIPLQPESADDVEFDGIEEIHGINDHVYKRRMVNCLMQGLANSYIHKPSLYINKIYELNPQLLVLYPQIIILNEYINFMEDANTLNESKIMQGSTSDVIIKTYDKSSINVIGVNFLALLHESIRAMLDLISFGGLPKDKNKIKYVLKKADFRLASNWDTRFGNALWKLIDNKIPDTYDYDVKPYLFYELVTKPCDVFNNDLQNIFANTKKGKEIISSLCDGITYKLDKEQFDDELESKKSTIDKNQYLDKIL